MDYRFYRGTKLEFPPAVVKHLHWLRWIGAIMIASFPVIGLLLMLNIFESSLFWFFAFFLAGGFGPVLFIIGMTYNSIGDRSATKGIIWQIGHIGKTKEPNVYRPDRSMIYDHYEASVPTKEDNLAAE